MEIQFKTLSTKEIKNLNINKLDVLGYDYVYQNNRENNFLLVNGKILFSFANKNDRQKTFNKIKSMGLGFGWNKPQLSDEENGITQASKNGENPFACTVMCSNPLLNEIVR